MNIAVFGAGGKSGRIFIDRALAEGHVVTANTFNSNTLPEHSNLTIVKGDATDQRTVKRVISGAEVVVSLVGHRKGSTSDMQTTVIRNCIAMMKQEDIKRLVSLTGTAVRTNDDIVPLYDYVANYLVSKVDPGRILDGQNHAATLAKSDLDWTIIRVLKLHSGPARTYTLREHGPTKFLTSRHEVATAILDVIESNQFIKKMPIISA